MKSKLYLAIDIGTSSCKACVFDAKGNLRSSAKREYPTRTYHSGFAEQDPYEILRGITDAAKEAVSSFPSRDFQAICFDTMLHSLLFLDREGKPAHPLLNWMDTRAGEEVEHLQDAYREKGVYARTAAPLHTIYHLPKLLWFARHREDVLKNSGCVTSIKGWVLSLLTGECAEDFSTASATGLLDLRGKTWSLELLKLAHIKRLELPPLVEPEHTRLLLEGDFSRNTGLPPGLAVVWGGGDGPFANLGEGIFHQGEMLVTVGSSGAVRMCAPSPVFDEGEHSWCYYLADGIWVAGGAINNGGIVYSWMRDLLGEGEVPLDVKRPRPLFLPFLTGERSPNWDPFARGVLFGLSSSHDRFSLLQAALEGVGFRVRSIYEMLVEVMGEPHRVVISGGLASTVNGRRLLTDILGRKVEVSELPSASARGAFLVALKAQGAIESLRDLPPRLFPNREEVTPLPEAQDMYDKLFRFYEKTYRHVQPLFREFARFELG